LCVWSSKKQDAFLAVKKKLREISMVRFPASRSEGNFHENERTKGACEDIKGLKRR